MSEFVVSAGKTFGVMIETTRLRIRSLRDDDLADLVMLIDNWEVARWTASVPYPYTEADGRTWIALVQQDHATGLPRSFAVALKDTDRLIGSVALTAVLAMKARNPRSATGWASLIGATGMDAKLLPLSSITASRSSALIRSARTLTQVMRLRKRFSCTAA
jgi:hypothetical protein